MRVPGQLVDRHDRSICPPASNQISHRVRSSKGSEATTSCHRCAARRRSEPARPSLAHAPTLAQRADVRASSTGDRDDCCPQDLTRQAVRRCHASIAWLSWTTGSAPAGRRGAERRWRAGGVGVPGRGGGGDGAVGISLRGPAGCLLGEVAAPAEALGVLAGGGAVVGVRPRRGRSRRSGRRTRGCGRTGRTAGPGGPGPRGSGGRGSPSRPGWCGPGWCRAAAARPARRHRRGRRAVRATGPGIGTGTCPRARTVAGCAAGSEQGGVGHHQVDVHGHRLGERGRGR